MKNYIIKIVVKQNEEFDTLTTFKALSNAVAFCGDLYSADYHGYGNGIDIGCENDDFYVKIILNEIDWDDYDVMDTVKDFVGMLARYGTFDSFSVIEEVDEPTEIPEYFMEHYYINSYHDFY